MEYVLYLDRFFLTNLIMNLLSLYLAACVLRQRIRPLPMAVSAMIGSVWNCYPVLFSAASTVNMMLLTVFPVGSLMCICAFDLSGGRRRPAGVLKALIQADLALLVSEVLLGGFMAVLYEHLSLTGTEILTVMVLSGILCGRFLRRTMKERRVGNIRYTVFLQYDGRKKEFCALADSGNRLTVPGTGLPVSLISGADCEGFCETVRGGFYIPYRAVGTEQGMLFALRFEKMEIIDGGSTKEIDRPVVAIVKERLSSGGEFSMIIPEEYVSGNN